MKIVAGHKPAGNKGKGEGEKIPGHSGGGQKYNIEKTKEIEFRCPPGVFKGSAQHETDIERKGDKNRMPCDRDKDIGKEPPHLTL